jgi:catechol 2,3-dioxygenase-like lactoylglutathione lyase family enzyme
MEGEMSGESGADSPPVKAGEVKLEVVVLPVSDVDRAKRFYEGMGWRLDADLTIEDGYRVVQLTPPGSACSIIFGEGADYGSFAAFSDPDGNGWLLQEIKTRLPGR